MKPDRVRGDLAMLLLAVLGSGPAHGYAISAELRRRTRGRLAILEGSLYPALQRLEGMGLVSSAWDSGDGRRRRVYQLTREGKGALREGIREWEEFRDCVDTVLSESP
jgi:PadR family transcriptional regulator PadR